MYRWCSTCQAVVNTSDWQKHRHGHEPKRSKTVKSEAVKRQPFCEQCGSVDRLEAHHRNGDPTDNRPQNIGVLCFTCHRGPGDSVESRRRAPVREPREEAKQSGHGR